MRIVFASTPSQEEEISEQVRYIYTSIFPLYYVDNEIEYFERLKVLNPTHFEDFSTLKDAFHVMTCLQTIISILEQPFLEDDYEDLFNKNVDYLQSYGLFFPFQFEQFKEAKNLKKCVLSVYAKADNEMLI